MDQDKVKFINSPYLHATFLRRSNAFDADVKVPKRKPKHKKEIGIYFPLDYYYPEVFFKPKPKIVSSPWELMRGKDYILSLIQTPHRKLKRRLIKSSVGY